jgi:hypothetical protein
MKLQIGIIVILLLSVLAVAAGCVGNSMPTLTSTTASQTVVDFGGVNSAASSSTTGLSLTLSLDAKTYYRGQEVQITINEINTLTKTNNLAVSDQWPFNYPTGLLINRVLCDAEISPFRIAVLKGEYTAATFKTGTALLLEDPRVTHLCTTIIPPSTYAFKPSNGIAVLSPAFADNSSPTEGLQIRALETLKSYWTPGYVALEPGTYTVVGADEWGSVVVTQFTVAQ